MSNLNGIGLKHRTSMSFCKALTEGSNYRSLYMPGARYFKRAKEKEQRKEERKLLRTSKKLNKNGFGK